MSLYSSYILHKISSFFNFLNSLRNRWDFFAFSGERKQARGELDFIKWLFFSSTADQLSQLLKFCGAHVFSDVENLKRIGKVSLFGFTLFFLFV